MADNPPKQCKRTAGLKPWKPGESGNPKGMSKGTKTAPKNFTDLAKKYLDDCDPNDPLRTRAERIIESMYAAWEAGDMKAAALILDRVDPAIKKLEVTGVAAEQGNQMLDRLLQSTMLPIVSFDVTSIAVPVNGTISTNGTNGNGHANGNGH